MHENLESVNSSAYFDSLFISIRLQELLGSVSVGELHLLAYLSCLLGLYESYPVAEWGYEFTGTTEGAPYSRAIAVATDLMETNGVLLKQQQLSYVTDRGFSEYGMLSKMYGNTERQRYLEGACSSLLGLPIGALRGALSREPELRSASIHRMAIRLLGGPGLESLYEQFELLRGAIQTGSEDILAPAMVWLTYLSRDSATSEAAR